MGILVRRRVRSWGRRRWKWSRRRRWRRRRRMLGWFKEMVKEKV